MKDLTFMKKTFLKRFLIATTFQVVFLVFISYLPECRAGVADASMEDQLKEALRKDPDSITGNLDLAKFYLDRDEFAKAEESFKKVLRIDPSEDKAFEGLGMISLRRDDTLASLDRAIQLFARASEIDPKNAKALAYWGEAVGEKSRVTDDYAQKTIVLESIQKSLQEDPSDADVYERAIFCYGVLGAATYDNDLIDSAISLSTQALALDPKLYGARVSLARIHMVRSDYKEAARLLDEAVEINARRSDAYRLLAELSMAQGMQAPAEEAATKALEINPNKGAAYGVLAKVYAAQGKTAKAEEMIEAMLALEPRRVDHLLNAVSFYFSGKNFLKAEDLLNKAFEQNSKSGDIYLWRARLAQSQGREEEAEVSFLKAVELSPGNEKAFAETSAFYEGRGDAVKARGYSQRAAELNPKNNVTRGEAGQEKIDESGEVKSGETSQVKIDESSEVKSGETSQVKIDESSEVKIDEANKVKSDEADKVKIAEASEVKSAETGKMKVEEKSNVKSKETPHSPKPSLQASVDKLKNKLRLNPRDEGASVALASLYLHQGKLVEAEGLLSYVVRLNPKNDEALAVMGYLELQRKNKARAEGFFASSLRINPKNKNALRGMQALT